MKIKHLLVLQVVVALLCFNIEGLDYAYEPQRDITLNGQLVIRHMSWRMARLDTRYDWPADYIDIISDETQTNSDRPVISRLRFVLMDPALYSQGELRLERHPNFIAYVIKTPDWAFHSAWPNKPNY